MVTICGIWSIPKICGADSGKDLIKMMELKYNVEAAHVAT